jgi:hypothetical protein
MDAPLEIEQRCTAGVKGSGCVQRQARAGRGRWCRAAGRWLAANGT